MGIRLKWCVAAVFIGLLVGCADIPKDSSGTLNTVRSRKIMRVGLVSNHNPTIDERQTRFVDHIGREASSRPQLTRGSSEELLTKLESGRLDLVVGSFASDSPWNGRVAFVPDRPRNTDDAIFAAAAVRNGENAWLTFVYRRIATLENGR
jgi:hypothetical protein